MIYNILYSVIYTIYYKNKLVNMKAKAINLN